MSPAGSSTGRSASRSNSLAVTDFAWSFFVLLFLVRACTADRDDADGFFMAICHRRNPRGLADPTHNLKPRLVARSPRAFNAIRVAPQRLRLDEIDAVFRLVRG